MVFLQVSFEWWANYGMITAILTNLSLAAIALDPVADQIRNCGLDCRIDLPGGTITATEPWEFDGRNVRLESAGAWTTVQWRLPPGSVFALSTIGCERVSMERITFALRSDSYVPQVGWLAARAPAPEGAQYARSVGKWTIDRVNWSFKARKASVYLIGIECEVMIGCGFSNNWKPSSAEPGYALYLSDGDDLDVPGDYSRDPARNTSASHVYVGCNLGQYAWTISAIHPVFPLGLGRNVHDLRWTGGSVGSNPYMTAVLHVRGTGNYNVFLDAPEWEAANTDWCIQVDAPISTLWWIGGLAQARKGVMRPSKAAMPNLRLEPARKMVNE